jgi:hypothetical protein
VELEGLGLPLYSLRSGIVLMELGSSEISSSSSNDKNAACYIRFDCGGFGWRVIKFEELAKRHV